MDLDRLSDEELLVRTRHAPEAFGVFYRRHVAAIHGYFRRRVTDVEAAFDLTAETFAAALRSTARYEPGPAPARAWLFGIARNMLLEALRRGRVEDKARRALAMQPIALDDEDIAILESLSDAPALEAVQALPDDQRTAILARHVEGESYAEIAERLACSQSVVRQRVSRGLSTLRVKLQEER